MYIVKADNPSVGYRITPPTLADSEGNTIPTTALAFTVISDNPGAVAVTRDPVDPLAGTVAFGVPNPDGSPSVAALSVLVTLDGTAVGSFGAQFTIVPGDPASIVGGTITFDTLTEV